MRGVYTITETHSRTVYVGQADNIERRWRQHRSDLRLGSHENSHLQRSWDKHGADAFAFEVREECLREQLGEREQFWLDRFWEIGMVFNHGPCVNSPCLGVPFSVEARRRMAEGRRGMKLSLEHRKNVSLALRGKKRPPRSAEHCAKLSVAAKRRPPFSAEHRARLSVAAKRQWDRQKGQLHDQG